jgi:aspartokinase-like uncharacterized kinase
VIHTVIKVGGAALAEQALAALERIPHDGTLIVPGGGPFADTVRLVDERLGLGDDAAHWAAILAMDQYAYALASLVRGVRLVHHPRDLPPIGDAPGLPVLAPYQWLRAADPLPHSWDVTSDSIAAWVAVAVGAARLLLVKPVSDGGVDRYFSCVRASLDVRVLGVDAIETIQTVLAEPAAWAHLSSP